MEDVRVMTLRRLEIGPGRKRHQRVAGFETIGLGGHCQTEHEWGATPMPFTDGTFVEIFSSHCLEHVPWFRTVFALRDAYRILVGGGVLEVWVPDFEYLISCYHDRRCGDDWRVHNEDGDAMTWLNGRIFTYGPGANWHRAVFDAYHLSRCLTKAGFVDVVRLTERTRGVGHGEIDLGMRARKP